MRRALPLLVSLAAVAAVIVPYVALGGASYAPTPPADPCARAPSQPDGLSEALEQVALTGLDTAACKLGVAREDLVLAIRSEDALDRFAERNGIAAKDAEQTIQDGLLQALDDARANGTLSGLVAGLAERVIETVPPHLLIEALEQIGSFLP